MYKSPNAVKNNKRYYQRLLSDEDKANARKAYYKNFRERHKERLKKERKEKYDKNKDFFRKRSNESRAKKGGKFGLRKDGLTHQQYATLVNFNKKIKAMQKVSGELIPKCCKCGESDYRLLSINHINGGGRIESIQTKHANIYTTVFQGRQVEDLDVRCFNCNILYEYEVGRRFTPINVNELYLELTKNA